MQHDGDFLSWQGKRWNHDVKCRLDMALSNNSWAELYPSGRCEYLRFESSDHRPLITYFEPLRKKKKGIFRYDCRLNKNPEVSKLVKEVWSESAHLKVKIKVDRCRTAIITCSKKQREAINKQTPKVLNRERNGIDSS